MLSAWVPPSFNSRKRAPGPMPTLDTIGGDRGAPGPTTVRALAHQRKNRPQCRKRLTITHAMPAVSSTVGRRVSAGGNYRDDFGQAGWPQQLRDGVAAQTQQIEIGTGRFARLVFGRDGAGELRRAQFL